MADGIRKAVVPIAGLGTRLGAWARAVPKCMLPIVRGGRLGPVVHHICAEAAAAGAERVALVVSPAHAEVVGAYFQAVGRRASLPAELAYIPQPAALGLGDAVARAAGFVADEPFLVLLGDHVHVSAAGRRACAAQVVEAFGARGGAAMIGVQDVGAAELPRVGAARGEPLDGGVYRCAALIEKPSLDRAARELVTPGLPPGRFLAHAGIYVFTPEIFECLRRLSAMDRPAGGEIELTDAESMLLSRGPRDVYLCRIDGRAWDTGTPAGYAEAVRALSGAGD